MGRTLIWSMIATMLATYGCADETQFDFVGDGANPFLSNYEKDTGYVNLKGVEVEVTLEAALELEYTSQMRRGPAELAQFAVTYLRKRDNLFLEILGEDATAIEQVQWQVDGEWLSASEASDVPLTSIKGFRLAKVNAVILGNAISTVAAGTKYEAEVPVRPFKIMAEAKQSCADSNSHIDLSQSIYWYLWNPTKFGCEVDTQTMTVTIEKVLPQNPETYPEYDELWADNRLDVVILWAKLDEGDVAGDYNWDNVKKFTNWLLEAGFEEMADAPLGTRFVRKSGEKQVVVDMYGPDLFHSVADYSRLHNWQKAVTEHEVVMYNGHSVLGSGMAFERVAYPDHYQIFNIASCLSYEYYVEPILEGKSGWENVDVISNVYPTYYHENLPLVGALLDKLIDGFENGGKVSWQEIMAAVSQRLGHSRFGVSGARGNCFTPGGSACTNDPFGGDEDPEDPFAEDPAGEELPGGVE